MLIHGKKIIQPQIKRLTMEMMMRLIFLTTLMIMETKVQEKRMRSPLKDMLQLMRRRLT